MCSASQLSRPNQSLSKVTKKKRSALQLKLRRVRRKTRCSLIVRNLRASSSPTRRETSAPPLRSGSTCSTSSTRAQKPAKLSSLETSRRSSIKRWISGKAASSKSALTWTFVSGTLSKSNPQRMTKRRLRTSICSQHLTPTSVRNSSAR